MRMLLTMAPKSYLPTDTPKQLEKDCLVATASLPPVANSGFTTRPPHLYFFDEKSSTQVQEYITDSINLKDHALGHSLPEHECLAIGRGVGLWLRHFHNWGQLPAQSGFRERIGTDPSMQELKHFINYTWLVNRVSDYPNQLSDAKGVFEQVQAMTRAELSDPSKMEVIHGDFWTGK